MNNFILYLNIMGDLVPVSGTDFKSHFSTYDEQLQHKEHDQYTLTFSIAKQQYIDNQIEWNPLFSYYYIGAKMRLNQSGNIIDLVISNIAPSSDSVTAVYQITAQDELSYKWSKNNIGYNYSTLNSQGLLTTKSVFVIAREVLEDNYLFDWTITSQSLDAALENEKISLELTNSNPYNVIIEAANTVNAYLRVNYNTKTLDFYRKRLVSFSGYRYHPALNAINYNATHSGEQLTTMLHVHGGTNADGMQISMVPIMPEGIRNYFYQQTNKFEEWELVLKDSLNWESIRQLVATSKDGDYFLDGVKPKFSQILVYRANTTSLFFNTTPTITHMDYNSDAEQLTLYFAASRAVDYYIVLNAKQMADGSYRLFTKEGQEYIIQEKWIKSIKMRPASSTDIAFSVDIYTGFVRSGGNNYLFLPQATSAFVPVIQYQKNDKLILNNFIYSINYNNINNRYEGIIQYSDSNKNYSITIPIKEHEFNVFDAQITEDINIDNTLFRYYKNVRCAYKDNIGTKDIEISLYQKLEDIKNNEDEVRHKQLNELNTFCDIMQKLPTCSSIFVNFDIFKPYMSEYQWDDLQNLITRTWRNYNIQLMCYNYEYYTAIVSLQRIRNTLEIYGEEYGAACVDYENFILSNANSDNTNEDDNYQNKVQILINNINNAKQQIIDIVKTSGYYNLLSLIGCDKDLEIDEDVTTYFKNRIKEKEEQIQMYLKERIGITSATSTKDFITSQQQAQSQYYTDLIKTAQVYTNNFNIKINGELLLGIYPFINQTLQDNKNDAKIQDGLGTKYKNISHLIKLNVLNFLYSHYRDFIYENTYENTDEIDSVGLFNQAFTYFADLNRIQSSHSLEILDIGELEQINVPRLSIGSTIQVQNKDSINAQPYSYLLGEIEKQEHLYKHYINIKHTDEAGVAEALIEKFKNQLVDQYKRNNNIDTNISYEQILDKIYYDEVFVTGITNILREPLKDSVTIEQPSQYKTILSKLIKSI